MATVEHPYGRPARTVGFRPPRSPVLVRGCCRDYAAGLVRRGLVPRGSIWSPGIAGDRPDIGNLYGPDPDWHPPKIR